MELQWIGVAFVIGFLAKRLGQPPLLGFLAAGFLLEFVGARPDEALRELADLGVKVLLFTIGLKLEIKSLIRPQVWATTLLHMGASAAVVAAIAFGLGAMGLSLFAGMTVWSALLLGFAASFSSTVFVMKVLEERDDLNAMYGKIGVGVLVMQDLAAVLFLAASSGKVPSVWALGLLLLVPLRRVFFRVMDALGHGELLVLAGLSATLGGASLFELVGMKGDLGALVAGVVLGGHPKTGEMAKSLLGIKDVFLVDFFLTVGLTGLPTVETTLIAAGLVVLLPLKAALFLWLLTRFKLRARTSILSAVSLGNYSEFALIVGALAATEGWLDPAWLIVFATALALSFLVSAPMNEQVNELYRRHRDRWLRLETSERLPEERTLEVPGARALVFGMGRVGRSAYEALQDRFRDGVVGFDIDAGAVQQSVAEGRRVVLASATDADFWERLKIDKDEVELVLLSMSSHVENQIAIRQLRAEGYKGLVAATARYADELDELKSRGADVAYHVLAESGAGFVRSVIGALDTRGQPDPGSPAG